MVECPSASYRKHILDLLLLQRISYASLEQFEREDALWDSFSSNHEQSMRNHQNNFHIRKVLVPFDLKFARELSLMAGHTKEDYLQTALLQ